MKEIPLTQGHVALVDDADYESVSKFKWHAHRSGKGLVYARRNLPRANGKQPRVFMHTFLMSGIGRIDHRNGDGRDNQRHNLRPSTRQQNSQGFRRKPANSSSQYRGVNCRPDREGWGAQIRVDGNILRLGWFKTELEAALAYDSAAKRFFGEFASPNFPA